MTHIRGVQLATMQNLAQYWATDYDWSRCEAQLAALPHFITEIDGDILPHGSTRQRRANVKAWSTLGSAPSAENRRSTSISSTSVRSTRTRCR